MLELAKRHGQGPISAAQIATAQSIPQRFLETILNELKPTGLVDSRRGAQGGFYLTSPPDRITVGQVIRFVDGPLDPVRCDDQNSATCALSGQCALTALWSQAREAVEAVYDATTFQNLVDRDRALQGRGASDYSI
jgi:Rrf2 family protein